jgi:hypothetical protein
VPLPELVLQRQNMFGNVRNSTIFEESSYRTWPTYHENRTCI